MNGSTARRLFLIAVSTALLAAPCPLAGDDVTPRAPTERDRCTVCGMAVAPHPAWVAQVVFADGSVLFFDGAKDMFRYLLARQRFAPGKSQLQIAACFATGYYDLEPIRAEHAHFVVGSDVRGPMGGELIPFAAPEDAEQFLRDHSGERVVRFAEVSEQLLRSLK